MRKLTDFPFTHVLVLGLAKSGLAAANLLLRSNITVRVNDFNSADDSEVVTDLRMKGAEVIVGSHPLSVLDGIDLIVKNPGIPYENVVLIEALKRNIPIVTEIELAASLTTAKQIIGITGSNGKTTTTSLVNDMLLQSKQKVMLAGNIGIVASEVAQEIEDDELLLLELSSFQLMGTKTFKPHIAVLLNLYEAHIDYHGSASEYYKAKLNIFKNQLASDYLIYNADDPLVVESIKDAQAKCIPFSTREKMLDGAWCDDKYVYFMKEAIMLRQDIVLVGEHNLANALAAIATALTTGATIDGLIKSLTHFSGVKHRLQFVKEVNGRKFYNDSKATNMLATEIALKAFQTPTILLAGGLDRGDDFDLLLPYLKHVKTIITFGETAEKLTEMAKKAAIPRIFHVDHLSEAVHIAYENSDPEDTILLSPACASWDQYKSFEERGDIFINTVHTL